VPAIPATAVDAPGALRAEHQQGFHVRKDTHRVLDGLSLEVDPGELTLISGPSGCGKSTLLASLSGLTRVDGGRVMALGQDLVRLTCVRWSASACTIPASCSKASTCFRP
jgi:putative ABC transport system ATP-binding protein